MTSRYSVILLVVLLSGLFLWMGCDPQPRRAERSEAQRIVDDAIAAHGGEAFEKADIEFDFRNAHFRVWRDDGMFRFTRTYTDTSGAIVETMSNNGFTRTANGRPYEMDKREFMKLTEDVNSVVYFALLPYKLNDPSVKKKLLGRKMIEGQPYHEIEVTFEQEGGGRDWEDRFVFWIHSERSTMDYLAYHYTLRGTSRFRKAKNVRVIGGIRFADYMNFRADTLGMRVEDAPLLFESGDLESMSEILTENIQVKPVE